MKENRRRPSQKQIAFWVENEFLEILSRALKKSRMTKSQYIRDAVIEKMQADGFKIREDIGLPAVPYANTQKPVKYTNNPVSEQMVAEDQSEYGKPKKPAKIEIDPANLYDDPEKPGKSLSGMKLVEYYPNKYKIRVGTPENPVKIFGTKDHWDEGETILIEGEGRMSKDDYIKMMKEQQIQKSVERFNRNVKKMMGAEDEEDSDDNPRMA